MVHVVQREGRVWCMWFREKVECGVVQGEGLWCRYIALNMK